MKPPQPPLLHFPHDSKKGLIMDPDVVETPLPVSHKESKEKQVIVNEVIDVDDSEELDDVMSNDEKINGKNKGKAVQNNPNDYKCKQAQIENTAKLLSGEDDHNPDDFENDNNDFSDGSMDFDEEGSPQAHFDDVNIPPEMQAPLPWLHGPFTVTKKIANESNPSGTGGQTQSNAADFRLPNPAHVQKELRSVGSSSYGPPLPSSWSYGYTAQSEKKLATKQSGGNSSTIPRSINILFPNHVPAVLPPPPGVPQFFQLGYSSLNLNKQGGTSSPSIPYLYQHKGLFPPQEAVHMPLVTPEIFHDLSNNQLKNQLCNAYNPLPERAPRNQEKVDIEDVLRKFQFFKRFDLVEDHSDHHYSSKGSSTKQSDKAWAKKIQNEWRILENDLPDAIFVRVYETRMDLLRAVIVGAEGTPYHDGLFFFDVLFPSDYPNQPPRVHYHSGGLRLNPNLYNCGKVCLSLLGTWHGNKNENWIPGMSTVLQVLVSIQALILNQKPFYNEPGYKHMSGSAKGEIQSQEYNDNTFMLSLKTMVYTMRKPPMHFEDFVMGHFHMRAKDIVMACKAYMMGAKIGCLVKGGVQDVGDGDKNRSKIFKETMPVCVDMLVKEFSYIGVKDSEKLETLVGVAKKSCNTDTRGMSRVEAVLERKIVWSFEVLCKKLFWLDGFWSEASGSFV